MASLLRTSGSVLANAAKEETPLPVSSEGSVFVMPATQGQVRFWSLDQMEPGNPGLNMPLMWQFTGPLNVDQLRDAFQSCIERHEMLRTTFDMVDGRLSQIIHATAHVAIPISDLSDKSGDAQRLEAEKVTRIHAGQRMNLKQGPLLLLHLLRFNDERHLLLITMHHIICDGISLGILMRDMLAFYEASIEQSPPRLPSLPVQYGDFAVWLDEWRSSEEARLSRDFWHKTIGREFNSVSFPQDSRRETDADRKGDIETLLIPRDLTTRAHAFCLRENVTFNMLLFSVFVAMISRLTGETEFTIGSPCANRTEDTEELIGLFMNIQVFRAQLHRGESFRGLLHKVKTWTLGAYENQMLPFEDLVHDPFFANGSSAFHIPIFFLYQKSFMLVRRIGDLEVVPLRSESPGAVFDVMFAVVDREEEGPRLQLEFDPRKHAKETVQGWLRLYLNLLESGIYRQDDQTDQLNVLSTAERNKLLIAPNQTHVNFGPFQSLPAQIMERAYRTPEQIALECSGAQWTHAQLLQYAQRLSQQLVNIGVRAGDLVAVAVDRSMEMVGAVLAVLFAGAAYVPLDPRHPAARLKLILEDCQPVALLHSGLSTLPSNVKLIDVRGPLPPAPQPSLLAPVSPESILYVIYTSGSTGKPKGVAVQHAAVLNLLNAMRVEPGFGPDDVLVAVTTLSFDIAALEIFLPLLAGTRLVLATDENVRQPQQLLQLIRRCRATVMQATPGAWRALVEAGWEPDLRLKALCGGEALSRPLADKLLERSTEVWNMYGPTETTIWSSVLRVRPGTEKPRIGPPIANTQFYVLDGQLQPVPIGFIGELHIGGDGLAKGYWNKPELTAERFLTNPFGSGRLYKTGDLARWQPNGTLEILGRSDFQVKVRGYRIELGDIENSLVQHPDVHEAVVVQRETEDTSAAAGINRLVAYVEAGSRASEAAAPALVRELEKLLKVALPDYMVPNAIVALNKLPRNTNGKVDRAALPDAFTKAGDRGIRTTEAEPQQFFPPRDVLERQLTEIWQTTLGIPRISIRASFFSLGVTSLAALRLFTKMNRIYATDLGLATLLSASTIESIAELIRNRLTPNADTTVVPIKPSGTRPPLFIVHGIGGNIISFHGLAMRLGADQPVYGIQAQGLLNRQPGLLRLEDMAAEYVRAMRQTQPQGPYFLLGYSYGGTVVMEMAHQLRAAGETVALVSMLDSKSTLYWQDLARSAGLNTRTSKRLLRFRRNVEHLRWQSQLHYTAEKLMTRARRIIYRIALAMRMRKVPHFMKDPEDLNRVALDRYELSPYPGSMVLFRASEQHDGLGPHDLGWSSFFSQGVRVRELEGDHERIFLEPMVEELATLIRNTLQESNQNEHTS